MNCTGWKIAPLEKHHLEPVVEVHLRAFPGFFLTFLGPCFLKEFYGAFLQEETGVAFVAEDLTDGRILGFVVGSTNPNGFFKRLLKRRWWAFCLASTTALFRRPSSAPRIFRALFYRGTVPHGPERALLSSIAVDPDAARRGLGKALVESWIREVSTRGTAGCYLTTDAAGNDPVNCFYQKNGWRLETVYTTPEGRQMNRYVHDF